VVHSVARYNPDGGLDTTFGQGGGPAFAALRLNPYGGPETAFGTGGWADVSPSASGYAHTRVAVVATDSLGRVIMTGTVTPIVGGTIPDVAVVRLTAAGQPYPSFDGDGAVTHDAPAPAGGDGRYDDAVAGLVDATNRILVVTNWAATTRPRTSGRAATRCSG
jgi:uncharacterized delta-60 repeat protein